MTSLPQYLAAISMVHQDRGFLGFSALDSVTHRLAQAWRNTTPMENPRVMAVQKETVDNIIQLALSTPDLDTLRVCTLAILDYVFFNKSISGHLIFPGDITVATDGITFHQRTTKRQCGGAAGQRVHTFNTQGHLHTPGVFYRWMNA